MAAFNRPMATFVSALRNGAKLLERRDDDGFDRLSNRYSVGILVMMAMFISTKSYVGDPIDCYPPKEFMPQWIKYTDNYCWIANTYYVPLDKNLEPTIPPMGNVQGAPTTYAKELTYYQWVPIILAFCAAMFAIPARIWAWASNSGGYDVQAMVKATKGTSNLNPEVRDKTIVYLVNQMDRLLGYRRPLKRTGLKKVRPPVGKRFGHFLFIAYMVVKCLYIANAVLLLFILNTMLGGDYHYYGIDVWREIQDPNFQGSVRFPYVTMCDFWVRRMGENKHKYSVQCVLPVNLFNEKVFITLWFWLVFVAAASIVGLILWMFTISPAVNRTFARKYLTIMGRINRNDPDDLVDEFISDYLRLDGVFAMRLILKNTNDAIGGEIMGALWDQFMQQRKPHFDPTTDDLLPRRQADEAV